jgi:tRNA(Ile)-lysidine synthase
MPSRKRIYWPAVATAFSTLIPHRQLHPMVNARVSKKGAKSGRWAVAFSGGADSLALLLILWAGAPGRWKRDFVAMHFNHRLRGRASDGDEKFCRQVCQALGITLSVGRWKKSDQPTHRRPSEADARRARFDFFRREMSRRRIRWLWLAHQQDDVAETMLMRLSRGSGTSGLAAPRPVQAMGDGRLHLRPLLTLKKGDIVTALKEAGAVWREDATNVQADYFRNRVRGKVLPAWNKASGRDALAGAALSRDLLEEDDDALEAWLDELAPLDRRGRFNLAILSGKPRAIWRRALHRWLLVARPETDLSRHGFNQLLDAIIKGVDTRLSLGSKGFAVVKRGLLLHAVG